MKHTFVNFITRAVGDGKTVLIIGDVGGHLFKDFQEKYPDRFYNVGVCEQTMIGLAAGLALEGLIPYVFTVRAFLLERTFEQLKMDVDYMRANVKLIGYNHSDTSLYSHVILDDKKLMSFFKNINSFYPETIADFSAILERQHIIDEPTYVSLAYEPFQWVEGAK